MSSASESEEHKPHFRYLENPGATWRNLPVVQMPVGGDFVVFSIDPVASVAHLDKVARRAARQLRTRRHVGLVMMMEGLAMEDQPVNEYLFAFLRKGLPPTAPPDSFSDLCIPVLPNTYHPTGYDPLRPAHPLPWDDCYISFTSQINFRALRVKTTPRDYTPVLPVDDPLEVWRLHCIMDDSDALVKKRVRGLQEGSLEAIATIPLPESPSCARHLTPPGTPSGDGVDQNNKDDAFMSSSVSSRAPGLEVADSDDVSMIGSIDAPESHTGKAALSPDDIDIDLLREFETMFDSAGSVDDPVVDIWYDLDMVKEVNDLSLFHDECAQIRRIVDDAEERLGIRAARDAAAAKEKESYARAAEQTKSPLDHKKSLLGRLSDFIHAALDAVVCRSAATHEDDRD